MCDPLAKLELPRLVDGFVNCVSVHRGESFLKTKELSYFVNHKSNCFSEGIAFFGQRSHNLAMTPEQSRAARGLLDWTQGELAKKSGVSDVTIRNFERGKTALQPASLQVIRTALEAAGVIFIDQNGHGPGVRLRDRA